MKLLMTKAALVPAFMAILFFYSTGVLLSQTKSDTSELILSEIADLILEGSFKLAKDRLQICFNQIDSTDLPNLSEYYQLKGTLNIVYGQEREAEEHTMLAYRLAKKSDTYPTVTEALNNLGTIYSDRMEVNTAKQYLFTALKIHQTVTTVDTMSLGTTYNNLSTLYMSDSISRGVQYLEKAISLYNVVLGKKHYMVGIMLSNLGSMKYRIGRIKEAIDLTSESIKILSSTLGKDNPYLASLYNNLSEQYQYLGDYEKSLMYHNESHRIRSNTLTCPNSHLIISYLNRAKLMFKLRRPNEALDASSRALHCMNKSDKPYLGFRYTAANSMGLAHAHLGHLDSAIIFFNESMRNAKFLNQDGKLASVYTNLGDIYLRLNKKDTAFIYLDMATTLNERTHGKWNARHIQSLINMSDALCSTGQLTQCDELLTKLESKIYDLSHNKMLLNRFFQSKFNLFYSLSVYVGGIDSLKRYARLAIESMSNQAILYNSHETDDDYLKKARDIAQKACLAMQKSSQLDEEFLKWLFNAVKSSRLDYLYAVETKNNLPDDYYELSKTNERIIDEMIELEKRIHFGTFDTDSTQMLQHQLFNLKKSHLHNYSQLKDYNHTNFLQPPYQSKADVDLNEMTTVVEYLQTGPYLFVLLENSDTFFINKIEWTDSLIENIRVYQDMMNLRSANLLEFIEVSHDIYSVILKPFENYLHKNVVMMMDDMLSYIPVEGLVTDINRMRYFIHEHQVSYQYSRSLWRKMSIKNNLPRKHVLVYAPDFPAKPVDTTFSSLLASRSGLWKLANSEAEVKAIDTYWEVDAVTGSDATVQNFTQDAPDYRIVHLATHGKADDRVGDYCYLAFTKTADSLDRKLYVRDIYNCELSADLVVLSACETGLGELQQGEGILSLARGFTDAGAKSVVSTLWSVDDKSTAEIMESFYKHLKQGETKDSALRHAKLEYLEENLNAHPFYWAAFTAVGDMSAIDIGIGRWSYWAVGVLLMIFIMCFLLRKKLFT